MPTGRDPVQRPPRKLLKKDFGDDEVAGPSADRTCFALVSPSLRPLLGPKVERPLHHAEFLAWCTGQSLQSIAKAVDRHVAGICRISQIRDWKSRLIAAMPAPLGEDGATQALAALRRAYPGMAARLGVPSTAEVVAVARGEVPVGRGARIDPPATRRAAEALREAEQDEAVRRTAKSLIALLIGQLAREVKAQITDGQGRLLVRARVGDIPALLKAHELLSGRPTDRFAVEGLSAEGEASLAVQESERVLAVRAAGGSEADVLRAYLKDARDLVAMLEARLVEAEAKAAAHDVEAEVVA